MRLAEELTETECLSFAGLLTHAGQSYAESGHDAALRTALHERDAILDVLDALEAVGAGSTHQPEDLVAFLQQ